MHIERLRVPMCLECRILGPLTHHLPPSHPLLSQSGLVRLCRLFDFRPAPEQVLPHVRDLHAEEYLAKTLERMESTCGVRLQVLRVDSDGSCLPHAVSRCLVGKELLFDALRAELFGELRDHEGFYRSVFGQGRDDATWAEHWAHLLVEARPTFGRRTGRWLGPGEHVVAMANVLSRPILVLDAVEEMDKGLVPHLFLPLRLTREDILKNCKGGAFPGPICIAWSSAQHNHFVSLVQVDLPASRARELCVKHTPPGLWTGIVEKTCYPHAIKYGGREFDMPITVPHNHKPGGWVMLTDELTKQEIRVTVPQDKTPGETFTAHLTLPVPPLERALILLVSENGKTARNRALKTVDTILNNLVEAGLAMKMDVVAKCSRLRRDNAMVAANVVAALGGVELLAACGFTPSSTVGDEAELVRTDIITEALMHQRDMVRAVAQALANWPSLAEAGRGEVTAGTESTVFGANPSYLASWAEARERYASDAMDTSSKTGASARRDQGVWLFGSGARNMESRKRVMDMLVRELRKSYEDVTHGTDLSEMTSVWDDEFLFNRRVNYVKCTDCGEDQEWLGPVDGVSPDGEQQQQVCGKCAKPLAALQSTARRMMDFVADSADEDRWEAVGGPTVRCAMCGTLNCPVGGVVKGGGCWKCAGAAA